MAKDCLTNCPNFVECYSRAQTDASMPVPSGGASVDEMQEWAKASYDCPGPEYVEETVDRTFPGLLSMLGKETTKNVSHYECPLDQQ